MKLEVLYYCIALYRERQYYLIVLFSFDIYYYRHNNFGNINDRNNNNNINRIDNIDHIHDTDYNDNQ